MGSLLVANKIVWAHCKLLTGLVSFGNIYKRYLSNITISCYIKLAKKSVYQFKNNRFSPGNNKRLYETLQLLKQLAA